MVKKIYRKKNKDNYLRLSKFFIIILSFICFIISSKGFSILYLFLLADLLCCSAVLTVFFGFYQKNIEEKKAIISILIGLFFGLLLFPSPDFSTSILVGVLIPTEFFFNLISDSLLFWSFFLATFSPLLRWKFN